MIVGKLRHRITIQQPVTSRESDGGNAISYSGGNIVWAQVKESAQNETEIVGKITLNTMIEVTVRRNIYTALITAKSRLIWEGNPYQVDGAITDERKIYRTIKATRIQ